MKSIKLKKAGYWMSVITLGIVVGISLQFAAAWTEPTVAPPGGNLGAPFNTSATPQNKAGSFSSSGSISAAGAIRGSQVCIGADCRAVWPSSGAAPVAGGLYGKGTIYGGCSGVLAPMQNNCTCPVGYTITQVGVIPASAMNNWGPGSIVSCYKN